MALALLFGGTLPLVQNACALMMTDGETAACCVSASDDASHPCEHTDRLASHDATELPWIGDCCNSDVETADYEAPVPRVAQFQRPAASVERSRPVLPQFLQRTVALLSSRGPPRSATHDLFRLNEVFLN